MGKHEEFDSCMNFLIYGVPKFIQPHLRSMNHLDPLGEGLVCGPGWDDPRRWIKFKASVVGAPIIGGFKEIVGVDIGFNDRIG